MKLSYGQLETFSDENDINASNTGSFVQFVSKQVQMTVPNTTAISLARIIIQMMIFWDLSYQSVFAYS